MIGIAVNRQEPDSWGFYEGHTNPNGNDHPAILFIGEDGDPPKVFTLEEVKAMLEDIVRLDEIGTSYRYAVTQVSKKLGIKLTL